MAEPSFSTVATVTTAVSAATGVVSVPMLSAFGLSGASVGAGLLGCVVVQIFLPPEKVEVWRIVATAVGSVIVASLGAPFAIPIVMAVAPTATVTPEHANAVAAAALGGFAKPAVLWVRSFFPKRQAGPGASRKGASDA